ncbi:MAG: ribosome small subunit-dependent GTPase A [Acidobacteriia bacterium]|nr:ribosome small subunit-dependent GTPase A [Terriglobia bacterium]
MIGAGQGGCTVNLEGKVRRVKCEMPVAPGDLVAILHEKVIAIAPRRTTLSRTDPANKHRQRVIAANLDLLVIVASIDDPPFRPGLVDRYLVAAARGGIDPILCVNKADLSTPEQIEEATNRFAIPWVRCSTRTGEGIEELRTLLAGKLSVLAGHSGVGKSSVLNALAGAAVARTGGISDGSKRGQHTTTSSSLVDLGDGARVIDTPGIRAFDPGQLTLAELRTAFPDFDTGTCRFADCTHRAEPDCAHRDEASPRYASWLRLAAGL